MTSLAVKREEYAVELEYEFRRRQRLRNRPLTQYQRDPVGFCVNELGIAPESIDWSFLPEYRTHQWDQSQNPIRAMMDALADWNDVGVESATGTGKSFTAACLILWFLAAWEDARVFTFAPKEDQLRLFIWAELRKLFPRFQKHFQSAALTDLCLRVRGGTDDYWSAHGVSVGVRADEDVAAKAAGMHAEHMLLVYEEAQGIDPAVTKAGENTCTSAHNLRLWLGNPDSQLDNLHLACISHGVRHIIISALDHPNVVTRRTVVPGAVDHESVESRRIQYGEGHRLYQSRVRGVSPTEAKEALVKLAWVNEAVKRWKASQTEAEERDPCVHGVDALGVDVANSESGDEGAIARMRGRRVCQVESFPCPNANDLGLQVGLEINRRKLNPYHVGVDPVGVGAGTVNELRKRPEWQGVRSLNGGYSPEIVDWDAEEYANLRSQMMWWLAEDLRLGDIDLPDDPELHKDLISALWEPKNGKITVESKEKIKERTPGFRSPNKADALAYCNFVRPRPEPRVEKERPRYDTERYPAEIRTNPVPANGWQSRPQLTPMRVVGAQSMQTSRVERHQKITSADGL